MKTISRFLSPFLAFALLILLSCTQEKTVVQPVTDQRPPLVEWISPQGGSAVRQIVSLTFMARDESGIDSARLFLDGTSRADFGVAGSNDSLYTFLWDTRSDSDGQKSLVCRAFDHNGNVGETPALLIRVQNTPQPPAEDHIPPQVTWITPTGGSEVSGTVAIALSAWDAGGVDSVRLYINGVTRVGWASSPTPPDTLYTYIWNTVQDSDGVTVLEARAWDAAGNTGVSPVIMIRVHNTPAPPPEDRTPPEIGWIEPVGGSELNGVATLKLQASDNVHVDSVWVYKNGISPAEWRQVSSPDADSSYTFLWNTVHDSDGVYVLEARAWDESRNVGLAPSLAVRVTNHPEPPGADRTPPRVTWLSPIPGSIIRDTTQLQFEATDDVGVDSVQVFVDGELSWSLAAVQNSNYSIDMNSWLWTNGRRIVEVRAYDSTGNVGIGNPIGLTVDNHRVIWVPDDYRTIQGAINASHDHDTVRVKAGVYAERLDLLDRRICLESESGPDATLLDESVHSYGVSVTGGQDTTLIIRGFKISSAYGYGVYFDYQSSAKFCNNIVVYSGFANLWATWNQCIIINNVFADNSIERNNDNLQLSASYGRFENNMIIRSHGEALWNIEIEENPLTVQYCLIWQYGRISNEPPIPVDNTNLLDIDPLLSDSLFHLSPQSPCINSGDPSVEDPDGSKSDIGAYGGPYAYTIRR